MIKNKKLFLLDIDGTVCRGECLIDGSIEFFNALKTYGGKYVFITNNTTKSVKDYICLFDRLGVKTDESNFITASHVTVKYLKENYKRGLIYVMGTKSFKEELMDNGIKITTDCNDENISCVLVAYNNELTYNEITDTCRILSKHGVDYIATNPDMVCPSDFGFVPDCGSICQMIKHAVKRKPIFIGKPEPAIVDMAVSLNNCTKAETIVVGDRLYTDILCGYNSKVDTALVLTGEATKEDAMGYMCKPNYIFKSIRELYNEWAFEFTKN